jgi:hypothetical protein
MKSLLFRRHNVSCRRRMDRCGTPHTVPLALLLAAFSFSLRAQDQDARIDELIEDAHQVAASLQKTIEALTDQLDSLRKRGKTAPRRPLLAL